MTMQDEPTKDGVVPSEQGDSSKPQASGDADAEKECQIKTEPPHTWDGWCRQPLPDALSTPYPKFAVAASQEESLPTPGNLERWRAEKPLRDLWRNSTEPSCIKETAKRFVERFGGADKEAHGILLTADKDTTHWIVGDVHGNAEGLMNAYAFVWAQAQERKGRHTVVLLGDIIDRGDKDLEALSLVESLLLLGEKAPVPVLYICGNHDAGLNLREDGKFASTVDPAETTDRLNAMEDKAAAEIIGRAAIMLAKNAPCMGEITGIHPDMPEKTLLFTHGGVPHVDLQEKVCTTSLLGKDGQGKSHPCSVDALAAWPADVRQACARDYVWVRIVDKLPHKIPNRGSSGCQIGTDDVNQFRKLHFALTGRAVSFIVRGHDHEDDGYRLYSAQEGMNENKRLQAHCGVLTINAMASDDMAPDRKVCVLRCHQGDPLTLYRIGVEAEEGKQQAEVSGEPKKEPVAEIAGSETILRRFLNSLVRRFPFLRKQHGEESVKQESKHENTQPFS